KARNSQNTGIISQFGPHKFNTTGRLTKRPFRDLIAGMLNKYIPCRRKSARQNYHFGIQYVYEACQGNAKIITHSAKSLDRDLVSIDRRFVKLLSSKTAFGAKIRTGQVRRQFLRDSDDSSRRRILFNTAPTTASAGMPIRLNTDMP